MKLMKSMNSIKIVVAGLGTVGSSFMKIIEENKNNIEERINKKIIICGVSAKNKDKKRNFSIYKYKWFDDPIDMINQTKPDIFIELMGHEKGISYDSVKLSINNGINIITANKALIAKNGNELFSLADKNNVGIFFEAAVAGEIPIIKTLKSLLVANDIVKISGILNGTTNYILSNMEMNNISFEKSFNEARNKGYVESNPELDIEGIDSAHKLSILSSLAFRTKFVEFEKIYREGISNITTVDINFAKKLNYVIKLLSVVELYNNQLIQYVKPMMIYKNSQLGQVSGVLNGIQITSKNSSKIFMEGSGAGGVATANSIVSDLAEICNNFNKSSLGINFNLLKNLQNLPIEDQKNSFYIRLIVDDIPGVLAEITSQLKDNDISIETMIQNPEGLKLDSNYLPLMFVTHETYRKNINNCIYMISNMESIKDKPVVIQIYKV
tara:strand:+ start:187 stop:1506 length:1320 start_codon:yes stop_codon:yes gene_type:complete